MKTLNAGVLLLILLLFISGCDTGKPDDLLKEETYLDIFTELVLLNQMRDEQIAPVSREYLEEQVFERHSTTREQFYSSHYYYQKDAGAQFARVEKLEKKLSEERAMIQAVIDSVEKEIEEQRLMQRIEVQEADSL